MSVAAGFPWLVPGLDFKSSVERVATLWAGSIPVPRRQKPCRVASMLRRLRVGGPNFAEKSKPDCDILIFE